MNQGAELLGAKVPNRGDQTRLAAETGIGQGYLSKIIRAERVPGLKVRRILKAKFSDLDLGLWDEPILAPKRRGGKRAVA